MAVATAPVTRHQFTVEDFKRMAEAGVLTDDARVELIAGDIIDMSPINERHSGCVTALVDVLGELVGRQISLHVQNPIRLSSTAMPQPDIAVLRRGRYLRAHPTPADVLLVIEVSDSSRSYDRNVKLPLYAESGIPEAWIIDLVAETIERHTDPRGGQYRQMAPAGRGETMASTILPAIVVPVDDILP